VLSRTSLQLRFWGDIGFPQRNDESSESKIFSQEKKNFLILNQKNKADFIEKA